MSSSFDAEYDEAVGVDQGAAVLDSIYHFLGRFIVYPSEAAHVAHVLWIVHTHLMGSWESTPRIAFLSPEPASGKTRALEITELLVPRAVEAVNVTPAYLFRKVGDQDHMPTILFDEIDTVFGPKAKENEEIRGLLNAGHRRGAVAGRCVVRGQRVLTEEIAAYCPVAMAGLGDLPDTLLSRSVIVRMRRRSLNEVVEPYRRRLHSREGWEIADQTGKWAITVSVAASEPCQSIPESIVDRDADIWEPLLIVADLAGGDWADRARCSAVALVAASKESTPSLGLRLLKDLRTIIGDRDAMGSEEILATLCDLDEAPWAEIAGGKPLNARGLGQRLRKYDVHSGNVRIANVVVKGYKRADLADAWNRYLSPMANEFPSKEVGNTGTPWDQAGAPSYETATSATSATDADQPAFCASCGEPMTVSEPGQITHPSCDGDDQ
jgi:hypothetical protein